MRKGFVVLGRLIILTTVLGAVAVVYSTAKGHTIWFFRVNGWVTVDGRQTSGYMHANTKRTALLVTRTDHGRPETYLVPLQDSDFIVDCGNWHPIRFFPVAVGDVNPPCSGYDTPVGVRDAPAYRSLITSRRSVEFSTASGKKVKAQW